MKRQSLAYFFALPTLMLALSVQAHEPKEHMNEAPDCAAMKDMDHSSMSMDDPVMQAMMQKCMKAMHQNEDDSHDDKTDATKSAGHQH